MPRGDGCATRAGRQPAEELCAAPMSGYTQMQDQSVYHSVTAQLTIQPSSSAVPSSVLLLAQTSLLRTKGTANQQTTNEDEDDAGAHLTLLNCTRVTPAASGPRVSVASTTSPLPSEPTCHHTGQTQSAHFALPFSSAEAHRCGGGVVGTIQLHVALQQPRTRQSHARRRDGCEQHSPLLCTSS